MPTDVKRPLRLDLSGILEGLLVADIDFILVGGLAAVIQGAPLTTMDVDIVYERSSENISKLMVYLESIDAVYRRPDDQVIQPREKDLAGMGHCLFTTKLGPLDVLAFIEQNQTYSDLFDHTVEVEFRGRPLRVLGLKTLIDLKRKSNDPKDKQRLWVLQEAWKQLDG